MTFKEYADEKSIIKGSNGEQGLWLNATYNDVDNKFEYPNNVDIQTLYDNPDLSMGYDTSLNYPCVKLKLFTYSQTDYRIDRWDCSMHLTCTCMAEMVPGPIPDTKKFPCILEGSRKKRDIGSLESMT